MRGGEPTVTSIRSLSPPRGVFIALDVYNESSVGYKIEQETFDEATHNISATNIRKSLGLK